ncbi:MAG: tetraacyldisaccharide 4'-kinase [Elusimicrobia bacterium]|nr:tetraacyldisaccharide 4'-kinase [Elusimicrobiota bacterium]
MEIENIRDRIKKNKGGYFFLFILSLIYKFLFKFKKNLYKKNIIKSIKFSKPVVCVGNISTGGTGKTTFVLSLSRKLSNTKIKHCIVLRGYKSKLSKNEVADINENNFENQIKNPYLSDEHKLIAISVKGNSVPVIASKNRAKSIEFAINNYHPDLIVMDDGFQNFSITKDLNILIFNINKINDKLLPLGNLREGYDAIKGSDFVVLNHCELFDDSYIDERINFFKKYINSDRIIKSYYEPSALIDLIENKRIPINSFNHKDIAIFSAIGDNSQFKKLIEKMGFNVLKSWQFSDHHSYTREELVSINNLRNGLPLITTLKDSVKFMSDVKEIFLNDIYAFEIEMKCDSDMIIKHIQSINKS